MLGGVGGRGSAGWWGEVMRKSGVMLMMKGEEGEEGFSGNTVSLLSRTCVMKGQSGLKR